MTLIAQPERTDSGTSPDVPPAPPPRIISVRQVAMAVVAAMIVLVLSWFVVEDPIAHVWYNARQHQRSSAINQARGSTASGQTLAVLQAPAIGLNVAVVEGDSGDLLRGGPGHAKGSPLPGQVGNSVIFGHSDGWGAPFVHIAKLSQGDQLYVRVHGKSEVLDFIVTSVRRTRLDGPLLRTTSDYRLTLVTGGGGRRPGDYVVVTAVSGTQGGFQRDSRPVPNPTSGPVVLNRDVGLFLIRGAAAALIVSLLRRRFRPGIVAALASPLVLAALLALMLDLDRFLSPLG